MQQAEQTSADEHKQEIKRVIADRDAMQLEVLRMHSALGQLAAQSQVSVDTAHNEVLLMQEQLDCDRRDASESRLEWEAVAAAAHEEASRLAAEVREMVGAAKAEASQNAVRTESLLASLPRRPDM